MIGKRGSPGQQSQQFVNSSAATKANWSGRQLKSEEGENERLDPNKNATKQSEERHA